MITEHESTHADPKTGEETSPCKVLMAGLNVVITANELNLSIFRPVWLQRYNVLREEEFTESALISPAVIQLPTPKFQLTILPNRVQMTFPGNATSDIGQLLDRVLGGILDQLPHTPFSAMGLNVDFFVRPLQRQFEPWNRERFASSLAETACSSLSSGARFGSYFSMDVSNMRMKLDAKPIVFFPHAPTPIPELATAKEWMHLVFNYHKDLNQVSPTADARKSLENWNVALSHARSIVSEFPG